MFKKYFWGIAGIAFLVIAIVGGGIWWWNTRIVSTEAWVRFEKFENNIFYGKATFGVNGVYNDETATDQVPVQVTVTPKTQFVKTVYYLPSIEELKKTNWTYNTNDLRKESVQGAPADIGDVSKGITGFRVKTEKNIWKRSAFTASIIEYQQDIGPF